MHILTSKKISLTALFTAFAVILSYIETFLPVVGIPGVKLGLANFAVILCMYLLGYKEAVIINIIRILILGMFFGNLFSILFSIAGALLSFTVMTILKKTGKVSIITVAIAGGVSHNIGQIVIASFVVQTYGLAAYLPVLMISGMITGTIIGILSRIIYNRTKHLVIKMNV